MRSGVRDDRFWYILPTTYHCESCKPVCDLKKNAAFTLAEVLITLGIIGVVAAMTMPMLIAKYQKLVTANKLKVAYSLIAQSIERAEADYGSVKYWTFDSEEAFVNKYVKPYFQVVRVYDVGSLPADFHHYCRTGNICDSYGSFRAASKIVLKNGMMLSMTIDATTNDYVWLVIMVDLNGLKNNSTYGKDTFVFSLDTDYEKLLPYGLGRVTGEFTDTIRDKSRAALLSGSDARSCVNNGIFCAAVIFMDNWQIKDDYPW